MAFFLRLILLISFLVYLGAFSWGLYYSDEEYKQIFIKMLTSAAGLSIIVAFFALWLTLENFLRKTNLNISGKVEVFSISELNKKESYDSGVSSFQLNNYKDKTVIIYKVFLKIGKGHFIKLLDVRKKPILLKAYDTHFHDFKQPLFYNLANTPKRISRIDLTKSNLYLDTNEGRYKVRKAIKHWNPSANKILIPLTTDCNYELEKRFIVTDHNWLNRDYYIEFDQEEIEISGIIISLKEINNSKELEYFLNLKFSAISRFSVSEPSKDVANEYPQWKDSTFL